MYDGNASFRPMVGILPKDFWTYTPRQNENSPTPVKDVPDPETVLFDDVRTCLTPMLSFHVA